MTKLLIFLQVFLFLFKHVSTIGYFRFFSILLFMLLLLVSLLFPLYPTKLESDYMSQQLKDDSSH